MNELIKRSFLLTLLLLIFCSSYSYSVETENDSLILAAARNGDIITLAELLASEEEPDRRYGNEKRALLSYSIQYQQVPVAEYLLELGFDVEKRDEDKSPLMFAAKYGVNLVVEPLIQFGADINAINTSGNTAFHYAARYNNKEMLRLLTEKGAAINIPNEDQWTALDYAIINNNPQTFDYLVSIGGVIFKKQLPDYFDGPYIDIIDNDALKLNYLVNRAGRKGSKLLSKKVKASDNTVFFKGLKKDRENEYYIETNPAVPPSIYDKPSKILVIGDIHGEYERMVEMLINGGVIDNDLNWTWGDGHLVFIGDILDRGDGVMEALWLIYKLERQAEIQNGKVHFLLGNHEVMVLKNDIRYISKKYYGLTTNLGITYQGLFSENTVIGKWLRTKNVVERIGNTLFVHAGISPVLHSLGYSLDEINEGFRNFLNTEPEEYNNLDRFLSGRFGPVWYRGYLMASGGLGKIEQEALEDILETYSSDQVVVGHTEVDLIEPVLNNRVYPVNIPLADKSVIGQALLIEGESFYRVTTDREKTKLN